MDILYFLPIIFNSLKFLQKEGLKINAFVILENHTLLCPKLMHSQAGAWERDIKRKGFMNLVIHFARQIFLSFLDIDNKLFLLQLH
jgi:hypothetical protein